MDVEEIFVPGGFPSRTYVQRSQLEKKFQAFVREPGRLVIVSGPSKSGKTVFVKSCLKAQEYIRLSGDEVTDSADFWPEVARQLEISITRERTSGRVVRKGTESALEGAAKLLGLGARAERKDSRGREEQTSQTEVFKLSSARIREAVRKSKILLLIDDFHFMPEGVRKGFYRVLKTALEERLQVVLVGVSHQASDPENRERDLIGRTKHIVIPEWGPEELVQIADRGFKELNLVDLGNIRFELVDNSFFSPHLMQELCLELCRVEGVTAAGRSTELNTRVASRLLARVNWGKYDAILRSLVRNGSMARRRSFEVADGCSSGASRE